MLLELSDSLVFETLHVLLWEELTLVFLLVPTGLEVYLLSLLYPFLFCFPIGLNVTRPGLLGLVLVPLYRSLTAFIS